MCAWVRSYGFIRTLPYQRFSQKPLPPPPCGLLGCCIGTNFLLVAGDEFGPLVSPRVPVLGRVDSGWSLAARVVVASLACTCRGSWWEKVFGVGRSCRMQCVRDTCVSGAWEGGGISLSLSLVLLAAAKHCLLLPRQDSSHAGRWFLTKREVWECQDISSQIQRWAEVRRDSAQLCWPCLSDRLLRAGTGLLTDPQRWAQHP